MYLSNLEKLLIDNGHQVKLCAFVKDQQDDFYRNKWNKFRHVFMPYKRIQNKLESQLKMFKPDIVHIHNNSLFTYSVLRACRKFPIVQTVHDPYQYWPPGAVDFQNRQGIRQIVRRHGNKFIERHIHSIITHSLYIHRVLTENGHSDKTTHIPIFTDLSGWRAFRGTKKENRIVFAGRIEAYKGIFVLLDAFQMLQKKTLDIHLDIYGHGADLELLNETIRKKKIANVTVHGMVDVPTLRMGVARARISIIPSIWEEPFGLSGIEAQACGTVVVASDVGGISEWCIDGVTGLLAIAGDPSDLANKMLVAISDQTYSAKLIEQAFNHLESHFSREKHYIKLIEVYSKLSYVGEAGS